jgi:hypothetical protein
LAVGEEGEPLRASTRQAVELVLAVMEEGGWQ